MRKDRDAIARVDPTRNSWCSSKSGGLPDAGGPLKTEAGSGRRQRQAKGATRAGRGKDGFSLSLRRGHGRRLGFRLQDPDSTHVPVALSNQLCSLAMAALRVDWPSLLRTYLGLATLLAPLRARRKDSTQRRLSDRGLMGRPPSEIVPPTNTSHSASNRPASYTRTRALCPLLGRLKSTKHSAATGKHRSRGRGRRGSPWWSPAQPGSAGPFATASCHSGAASPSGRWG